MPPRGEARNTGIWLAKPTDPSRSDDPVIRYTSQDWATLCIHVPISEMSWPAKKSWKLRCLSARNAVGSAVCWSSAGGVLNSGEFFRGVCNEATFARLNDAAVLPSDARRRLPALEAANVRTAEGGCPR